MSVEVEFLKKGEFCDDPLKPTFEAKKGDKMSMSANTATFLAEKGYVKFVNKPSKDEKSAAAKKAAADKKKAEADKAAEDKKKAEADKAAADKKAAEDEKE